MFFLGIIDTTVILINAIAFGYLSIMGAIFCTHPTFIYLIGCISLGLWCGACCTCMLLALNRCMDMLKPDLGRLIFTGKKTFYLLSIPSLYVLYYIWFTNPLIFNSIYYASLFDPFVGIPEKGYSVDSDKYPHTEHTVNNVIVMATLVLFYATLCVTLSLKSRGISSTKLSKMQQQMILQSSIICFFNLTAASIYVSSEFLFSGYGISTHVSRILGIHAIFPNSHLDDYHWPNCMAEFTRSSRIYLHGNILLNPKRKESD